MSDASDREIRDLDSHLLQDGQDIEIWRVVTAGATQINIKVYPRAFVRTRVADELVGGVIQKWSDVTLSPTEITAAGWPGPWTPSAAEPVQPPIDRRIPIKNDKCVIGGRPCNIELAKPILVDNELVRIEMRVLG